MDNVTHTLVGLVVGEAVYETVRAREEPMIPRGVFLVVSAVANNLPDLDILYGAITPGPLGYLVHHRGHTHTLLLGLLLGVLLVLAARRFLVKRRIVPTSLDARALWCLGLFGGWLHVALDFLNSYGVHPFWPVDGRWIYGDSIFIVEPLFWFALTPVLALQAATAFGRIASALVFVTGVGLLWFSGFVELPVALAATALAVALVTFVKVTPPSRRAFVGLSLVLVVSMVFAAAGRRAEKLAIAELSTGRVHDVAVSPRPADPSCWRAIVLVEEGDRLRTYRFSVEPLTQAVTAGNCKGTGKPSLDFQVDTGFWRRLAKENCWADAFLRFARFPVVTSENDLRWQVADARFVGGRGFTDMAIPKRPTECPAHVPGWGWPSFLR